MIYFLHVSDWWGVALPVLFLDAVVTAVLWGVNLQHVPNSPAHLAMLGLCLASLTCMPLNGWRPRVSSAATSTTWRQCRGSSSLLLWYEGTTLLWQMFVNFVLLLSNYVNFLTYCIFLLLFRFNDLMFILLWYVTKMMHKEYILTDLTAEPTGSVSGS